MIKNGEATDLTDGRTLFAVPSNVGPLTMPNYQKLFNQGVYELEDGIRVAGDPGPWPPGGDRHRPPNIPRIC